MDVRVCHSGEDNDLNDLDIKVLCETKEWRRRAQKGVEKSESLHFWLFKLNSLSQRLENVVKIEESTWRIWSAFWFLGSGGGAGVWFEY